MKVSPRPLLAAAVVALVCNVSWAQSGPQNPSPGDAATSARHEHRHEQMRERMRERMKERHSKALETLQSKLGLHADQASAWNSFSQAMQMPAQPPARLDRATMEKLTTPERIERMQALKTERDAVMQKRQQAIQTFYASLNAEQKKVFDQQSLAWMQQGMGARGQHAHHRPGHGH